MTTNAPSQQLQSRLLSLPRELRDEIYTYYLQEPGGYVHSPITNKLRHPNGQIIDFSLMWTCNMVASEMRDLPLRVNEVVFKPFQETKVSPGGSDVLDAWSQAGKFDFFLERLHLLQEEIFALAATTQSPEQHMIYVLKRYPNSCIGDILGRIMKINNDIYVPLAAVVGSAQSLTFHDRDVLQDGLLGLTSYADFVEQVRSQGWCLDVLGFITTHGPGKRGVRLISMDRRWLVQGRVAKESIFRDNRHIRSAAELSAERLNEMRSIIANTQWRPWILPTDEQIITVRDLFETSNPIWWPNWKDDLPDLRYFQSAASQAVRFLNAFLNALHPQYRKQMRNIKILEEEKCVALPECHLRGLFHFLDEIPALSVVRHVDLWHCVFPHDYGRLAQMITNDRLDQFWTECRVQDAVLRTITWINEATSLSWDRTGRLSVKTHFVGPHDTVQLIWNRVKAVAALYSAAVVCTRDQCDPFPRRDDLALAFAHEDDAAFSNPELLPVSVRQILSDDSLVKFPCIMGTLDEFEKECEYIYSILRGRPKEDWELHWKRTLEGVIEEEGVDFKTVQSRYADHRPSFD